MDLCQLALRLWSADTATGRVAPADLFKTGRRMQGLPRDATILSATMRNIGDCTSRPLPWTPGRIGFTINVRRPCLYRRHQVCLCWLRGPDSNRRPPGYEPDELPGCSTPR